MAVDEHLQTVRHSLAHVMAEAIQHLFPGAEFAIGPAIENGFYYDIDFKEKKISEEDFPAVEKEMRKILAGNFDFVRKELSRDEALKLFAGHQYKTELINDLPADATITIYTQDDFTDLCRGPHVSNTKEINAQAFKLTKLAGAYWRGDSDRPMLTRVYAVAFEKPNDLKDYLKMLEEAEKRDHRRLGVEMDLFHLDAEDPGQIFWHPNGWTIYTVMQDYMRKMVRRDGYQEVNTPAIMPRTLWERSGHWGHYQKNMFITESEKRLFAIKPMNCPGALEIFKSRQRSYKDLPLRLCARKSKSEAKSPSSANCSRTFTTTLALTSLSLNFPRCPTTTLATKRLGSAPKKRCPTLATKPAWNTKCSPRKEPSTDLSLSSSCTTRLAANGSAERFRLTTSFRRPSALTRLTSERTTKSTTR